MKAAGPKFTEMKEVFEMDRDAVVKELLFSILILFPHFSHY